MTVASFIASQRAEHKVPHVISCRALAVSESWFYKWRDRPPTPRQARRLRIDAAVKKSFDASEGTYGSRRQLDGVGEDSGGLHGGPGTRGPAQAPAPFAHPARQGG
jgi:hypothetical protein